MLDTTISVDVKSNGDSTYDAYIATENSSGSHYPAITAAKIGEHTADLIDMLEEADSGNSYLKDNRSYHFICDDVIDANQFAEYCTDSYFHHCDTLNDMMDTLKSKSICIDKAWRLTETDMIPPGTVCALVRFALMPDCTEPAYRIYDYRIIPIPDDLIETFKTNKATMIV